MPVEIRELHIKAVVGSTPPGDSVEGEHESMPEMDREALVTQCVERVLEVLEKKRER